MTHVQPKEIVTVQYIGEEPTRVRPFIGGDKVDVSEGDKIEMDARQAATVLIDHLRWKQIGEKKSGFATGGAVEKEEAKEEKPKAKRSK